MLGLPISYNSSTLLHKAFGFGEISPLCIEFASLTVDLLGNHRVGNVNLQAKHLRSAAELHGFSHVGPYSGDVLFSWRC